MNSIEKGKQGEDFVNKLAYRSLLKYWCYPGPLDEKGDRKEICDLLIIFDETVIIISVKNYTFNKNYSRYFRRTIEKAVKQIYGAERKLYESNRDIYIKHPDRTIELFNPEEAKATYRIIVNLGEGTQFYPFHWLASSKKYITIFNKDAFVKIIEELDTIQDFVNYLEQREMLFADKSAVILPGAENEFDFQTAQQFFEHVGENMHPKHNNQSVLISGTEYDLLAYYLKFERTFPQSLYSKDYTGHVITIDGFWNEFTQDRRYIQKKELDKVSYLIDELVKREILSNEHEMSIAAAKCLLSLDRFERRIIASSLVEFHNSYYNLEGLNFARRFTQLGDTGIAFGFFPKKMEGNLVNKLLEIAMDSFILYKNYSMDQIILIGITDDFSQIKIGFINKVAKFSTKKEEEIRKDVKNLGWFSQHKEFKYSENEYPE